MPDDLSELRSIYVIQIAPKWYPVLGRTIDSATEYLYVGQSKSPAGKRFKQHRRGHGFDKKGGEAAAAPFRGIAESRRSQGLRGTLEDGEDAWLRRDLMDGLEPVVGKTAAESLELATAERLREAGYYVFGPRPSRAERRQHNRGKTAQ